MQKEFTKADLKDGMVVEFDNGFRGMVLGYKLVGKNSFELLSDLTRDMKIDGCPAIKVYKVNKKSIFYLNDILDNALELIWERNEVKCMTVDEMKAKLEELTGEKIEVKQEVDYDEMLSELQAYCDKQEDCLYCQFDDCCPISDVHVGNENLVKKCYKKVMKNGE